MNRYVIRLRELGIADVEQVGGKNASLGEMIQHPSKLGIKLPGGFAPMAWTYHESLAQAGRIESAYCTTQEGKT